MIWKVVGCEDCVRENKLPLWGPEGEAPSRWVILQIFFLKKKQQLYHHLDDILNKMTCMGAWGRGNFFFLKKNCHFNAMNVFDILKVFDILNIMTCMGGWGRIFCNFFFRKNSHFNAMTFRTVLTF